MVLSDIQMQYGMQTLTSGVRLEFLECKIKSNYISEDGNQIV